MGTNRWVKIDGSYKMGPNRQVQKKYPNIWVQIYGQKRQVQIDGSKETDPNRQVQIDWSKKQNGPNISKLVQYGPKSTQKVSKWVRHNQVSWSSFKR